MTLPRTTADVLSGHVLFEVESVDRMYLNVYQPKLQYGAGVSAFFAGHRGHKYASSVLMAPITETFVANIHHFVDARGLDLLSFGKGEDKDAIAHRYLADFAAAEGVLFVGRAQEKAWVFRTQKRRNPATGKEYLWLTRPGCRSTTFTSTAWIRISARSSSSSAATSSTAPSCA